MSKIESLRRAARRGLPWREHRSLVVLCTMGLFAFILLVLSVFGEHGIVRIRQLGRDRVLLEEKVRGVERDNAALARQLRNMKEGRASYELAAREKLGLVKPGEVVYDFRPDPLAAR
jgi:cell division protein FtsB